MSIKLINHYIDRGYAKPFAIRMGQNRDREASKPLPKPSAEVIARRMLEQNIFGGVK